MDDLFSKFDGAFAPNTLRAYRSDFSHFSSWCAVKKLDPLSIPSIELAMYARELAEECSSATIRRRLGSLATVFKLQGVPVPTKSPEVILELKKIHRAKGRAQAQAVPLTRDVLSHLLSVCDESVIGKRDRVMLMLGYETMRRRSELCAFAFDDIESLPKGKFGLRLRFSKTDQFGDGKLLPMSAELFQATQSWRVVCGGTGHILRGLYRDHRLRESMSPATVNNRLKALQKRAGLQLNGELSGHSFRVGRALDLLEDGESLEKIMLFGGWNTESTAIRYLRSWQAI